jgi:hypothetical protein
MIKNPPRAENYFDFLLATGLLCKYLYFINRFPEGDEEASGARNILYLSPLPIHSVLYL